MFFPSCSSSWMEAARGRPSATRATIVISTMVEPGETRTRSKWTLESIKAWASARACQKKICLSVCLSCWVELRRQLLLVFGELAAEEEDVTSTWLSRNTRHLQNEEEHIIHSTYATYFGTNISFVPTFIETFCAFFITSKTKKKHKQ